MEQTWLRSHPAYVRLARLDAGIKVETGIRQFMDDMTSGGPALPDDGGVLGSDGRRDFLKKVSIGAAAAWAAPLVISTQAAHAQGTLPPIEFVAAGSNDVPQGTNSVSVTNPGTSGDT